MDANIESIVNDLKKVSIEKVTFEAITNSIQASATEISLYFSEKNMSTLGEEKIFCVDELKIVDNGDGFSDENISSFKTYKSFYKQKLGAKGVGRFLYLKLYKDVSITSLSKNIKFTVKSDVDIQDCSQKYEKTTITLSDPKEQYKINKDDYKKQVNNHFLAYFKMLQEKGIFIQIKFFFNDIESYAINSNDIPNFKVQSFKIKEHDFKLSYIINDQSIKINDGFYCAGNRVVTKNSQLDSKIKFQSFYGVNLLFLLSSCYFDENVNDERDDFNIKPIQFNQDMYSNLSWDHIKESLSHEIKGICLSSGIDIEKEARKNLQNSIEETPYLASYLSKNDYALSSDELIKRAEKDYESEKKFLRNVKNKSKPEYPIILSKVVQSELAEYIFDREKIITKLKNILGDKESLEKEVHNLFMKQYTEDDKQDYKSNNLWLFDDRFMTYDKVFSDAQIKKIFPELSEIKKKPDICIVSNTYEKEKITDIVIIELKRSSGNITPAGAEEQLLDYAAFINNVNQENKIRIWTYAFLKFDDETEKKLKRKDYNYILTHSKYPIYYKYYGEVNAIINFMDYAALADDAHARNQTFINILKAKQYES